MVQKLTLSIYKTYIIVNEVNIILSEQLIRNQLVLRQRS